MALELEALLFSVDSKPLEEAINKANQLTQAVQNLNKASQDSTKAAIDEAKVRVQLAKVAAEEAKAKIQNAKAEEAENKTKEAKLRLTEKEEKARIQNEAAIKKESDAQAKQVTILEKQSSVLDFMAQGFSKGQSGVLAMAQAAGLATGQMQELMNVLKQQRALMGANPFDKSQQGLTSLENQFKALNEATRQYNINSGLTREQTRELSRDKERIALIMQKEGKSINEIVLAQAEYANKYASMANKVNTLANAEKTREAGMREQANAIKAVAAAEERMKNSLEMINSYQGENIRMNERAALAMGSFERNLRLAGITGEEATKKLRAYKAAQEAVTEAEAQRAKNHLARGMTTQLGDIGISLWSGQNPLTVMLQQGDQVRDLIARSGVQGKELEKVMGAAVSQMVGSFAMLGTAVSAFVGGALEGLGNFILKITLVEKVVNSANSAIDKAFTGKFAENLKGVVSGIAPLLGLISGSLLAFGAAFAVAAVQTSNASDDMMKSIVRFGAAQGLTLDQAKNKAMDYSESTKTTMTSAMEFIGAFAKSGITDMDQYDETIKTAILMQKEFGVSAEDSAKLVKDIYDKPLEALIKIAQETGLVNVEQLEKIRLLEEEGKHHEANTYALEVYNSAMKNLAKEADANLSPLGRLWKDIKQATSDAWGEMQRMSESSVWTSLGKVFNYLVFTIKQILNGIGGIGTAIVKASSGDISGAIDSVKQIADNSNSLYQEYLDKNTELDKRVAESAKARSVEVQKANAEDAKSYSEYSKEIKKIQDKIDKVKPKRYQSEAEFIKASMAEEAKAFKDGWKLVSDEKKKELEAYYSQTYKDAHKGKTEAEKESARLEKARIQDMKSLMDIGIKYEGHLNKLTDAEIRYNQIVSHEDYKKKYNTKELQDRLKAEMEIAKSREQAGRNSKIALEIDKAWLEITKQLAQEQISIDQRNSVVDNELRIVGLVGKEREKATREIELQNKYITEQSTYEKNRLAIVNKYIESAKLLEKEAAGGLISPEQMNARVDQINKYYVESMTEAERLLAEGRLVSEREVNKKVTEDWFKEFNRITDGLTDVLVTALTEGGAAGGKKFREMIQAELKKPFVAMLNVVVRNGTMAVAQAVGIAPSGVSTGSNILGLASTGNSAYNLYSGATLDTAGNAVGSTFGGSAYAANQGAYSQGFSNGLTQTPQLSTEYGFASMDSAIAGNYEAAAAYQKAQEAAAAGEQAGATANTAMTYASYAYALYALSKGDYKTAGGTAGAAAGAQVGSNIMPGWGTAIGAVVGYLAGSALGSSLMGGGKKTEGWATGVVTASGVDVGTLPSGAVGSDENYARNRASSSEVYNAIRAYQDGIANIISSTAKGLNGVAEGLGISLGFNTDPKGNAPDNITGAVYNKQGELVYSNIYNADKGTFKEELGKESQRIIIAALKQIDLVDWADSVLAAVDPLKATAEELAATMVNLNSMKTLVGIFEGLGLKADNLSMQFVNLFGGFDGATKAINDYYEAYYTEEEKRARIVKNITTTLVNAGAQLTEEQVGNATKEEFRKVYEAVVSAQGAGSNLATAMLSVAGTFAGIAVASDSAKTSLESLKDAVNSLGDFEKFIVDESDKMTQKAIDNARAAYDALSAAITKEKAKLKDKYDKDAQNIKDNLQIQLDAYAIQLESSNNLLSSAKSAADKLKSAFDSVVDDSYSAQLERFKQSVNSLGNIASNNDIFNTNLDNILNTVQGDTKQFFGSYFEYAKNQALVKNDIASLNKTADEQVTTLTSVVKGIEAAKKAAQDSADYQLKVLKDTYDADVARLDGILENAKSQLDALNGINTSVLSLSDAMNAFANAVSSAIATSNYAGQQSIQAGMNTAYKAISGGIAAPSATVENLTKNKAADRIISPSAYTRLYVSSLGAGATLNTVTDANNFVARTGESMSVTEAAKVLSGAVSGIDTGKYSTSDVVNAAKYYGLSQQAALDLYNVSQVQNGSQTVTMDDFNAWLTASGIPAFADGGSYQGGLALVGENGPEMINFNQPGQVYNASQTSEILSSNNKDLIEEVKALRTELEMLRYESRATAINTAKLAKQVDRSAGSNDALKVQIVT